MIRHDIWSVKEWDTSVEPADFVHTRMFRSLYAASRYKHENQRGRGEMKIVHPADWVVFSFVAAGNEIWD